MFHSKEDFTDQFDFAKFDQDHEKKMTMVRKLHQIMRPFMLRRVKSDLKKKLPEKIEINISVPLTQLQIDMYSELLCEIKGSFSTILSGTQKKLPHKGYKNLLMQLRKVCNHPY